MMTVRQTRGVLALLLVALPSSVPLWAQELVPNTPGRHRIEVRSSADGSMQPSYVYLPPQLAEPAPLAVLLHSWSFDLEQRDFTVEAEARARGWILLAPNFRGRNDHPQACGSSAAQQDILDAVAWTRRHYQVDGRRIYLLGRSGGGYMAMLMAARHPEPWAAASAWVGISDLREWYASHRDDQYGEMMRACFGGSPTASTLIDGEYRARSPISHLSATLPVPLDLAAGRADSVVSVSHTLRAFQLLAPGALADAEVDALLQPGPGLPRPSPADTASDPLLGRRIFLRRSAGPSRVTVFEGEHEWIPRAAIAWLAEQRKP
jgi:dipeptidyl aminopeptidase/acylaminoacyl peptidase